MTAQCWEILDGKVSSMTTWNKGEKSGELKAMSNSQSRRQTGMRGLASQATTCSPCSDLQLPRSLTEVVDVELHHPED
jgi:hypothetical protein